MAEVHPNDIGLATFEDVGDVQKLLTAAKNVVSAINELYQNSSDVGDALGKQLYVDGENNVIIGQNNVVHGSNNLIVGSDNVVVGDNYSIFTDKFSRYGSPNGGYFYNFNTETNTATYYIMDPEADFFVPVGAKVILKLSTYWYNSSYSDMIHWSSPLILTEILEVNGGEIKLADIGITIEQPDAEHTICNDIIIEQFVILSDEFKVNETRNGSFVFGSGTASGSNSLAVGGYASGDNSFAANGSSATASHSASVNQGRATGMYSFGTNNGRANGYNSTAINSAYAEAPYSFATGIGSRVYGRAYKCVNVDEIDKKVYIASTDNTKELVGKTAHIIVYNSLNAAIHNGGIIESVNGNEISIPELYFPKDGYNNYEYFAKTYLFVVDTNSNYARGSISGGYYGYASGKSSFAHGEFVWGCNDGSVVFGKNGVLDEPYSIALANGTSKKDMQLAFKVLSNGSVHADSAYTTPCADYAEFFEWADGNTDKEDRAGYFVKLEGDKIVKCGDFDKPLGIVSATPAIIGDSSNLHWKDKYITDDFGRIKYHDVLIPEQKDEDGNLITEEHMERQPMISPEWDNSKEYVPRSERAEWSAVGVLGKLVVYDDGTLSPGDVCRPGEGGIAVKSIENGYQVLKRISEDKVLVWFKG